MSAPLRVEGDFNIVAAAAQRELWLGWLIETAGADFREWPTVNLDLGSVESFDSAGVQLLIALRASLQQRGQRLALTQASAPVNQALKCFGLQTLLPVVPRETAVDIEIHEDVDADADTNLEHAE